jgi:hypothetical protein
MHRVKSYQFIQFFTYFWTTVRLDKKKILTFLGVPDRSASTVLDRLHERLNDRF